MVLYFWAIMGVAYTHTLSRVILGHFPSTWSMMGEAISRSRGDFDSGVIYSSINRVMIQISSDIFMMSRANLWTFGADWLVCRSRQSVLSYDITIIKRVSTTGCVYSSTNLERVSLHGLNIAFFINNDLFLSYR
jgi:hypothetical protein